MLYSLVLLSVMVLGLVVAMAWPYNDVRFGSNTSTVLNPVVTQGGNLTVRNPSYCNDDQDITIERWAEVLDDNDNPVAAYELFDARFLNEGNGLVCFEPSIGTITLPNYVIGANGEPGRFRLHQIIRYMANPVNEVEVEVWSTPFLVLPSEGCEDERRTCPRS
jgi:hypothetical protein